MEYDKDGRLRPVDERVLSSRPMTPRVGLNQRHVEMPRVLPSGVIEPTAPRDPALVGAVISSSQRRAAGVSAVARRDDLAPPPSTVHPSSPRRLSDWATHPTFGSTARVKAVSYAQPNLGWGHVV